MAGFRTPFSAGRSSMPEIRTPVLYAVECTRNQCRVAEGDIPSRHRAERAVVAHYSKTGHERVDLKEQIVVEVSGDGE